MFYSDASDVVEENALRQNSQESAIDHSFIKAKCSDLENQNRVLVETIKELRGILKLQLDEGKRKKVEVKNQC